MIKDLEGTADFIANWIKFQAQEAHAEALCLGISGGVDSAVVAGLCARTGMEVVGVKMPCHSSPSSVERANEVIAQFELVAHEINLAEAFESIQKQISLGVLKNDRHGELHSREAAGALRSCLRAPTLDFVSKLHGAIIVGTGNRDEDEVTRYFQKRGDGCVDISPIAKLHKSEVYQLAEFLGVPKSVIQATPSADLWGPDSGQEDEKQLGMTYNEVEWGIRLAEKHGYNWESSSVRDTDFIEAMKYASSEREGKVLQTLATMEQISRHKENPNLPVCNPRLEHGLVE